MTKSELIEKIAASQDQLPPRDVELAVRMVLERNENFRGEVYPSINDKLKERKLYSINKKKEVPFIEESVLPSNYDNEPFIIAVVICMILGFLSVFLIFKSASFVK